MTIIFNGHHTLLPDDIVTVKDFTEWKNIPQAATAIALNGKLISADKWSLERFNELDNLLVISAAYGG